MNDPKNKLGQYAGLEQLSTQALEDLLQQDFAAGEDHSNPDLVMAIMEVMEQRTPQAAPAVDVDAAWNAFRAGKIAPMEPEAEAAGPLPEAAPVPPSAAPQKPRRRKAPRRALAVAAVVCVLVCLFILPVQGSSLLQNLVQWSDANFSFLSREPDGTEAVLRNPDYQQVEKTVSELTNRPVLPTWYPPGSSVVQVERHTVENGYYCVVVFSLDGQEFLLSVEIYDTIEDLPTHQYEKNKGPVEEYYANHISHYIMGNMERNIAVWRNGPTECSLHGFLSPDTLKRMIDSIYE